MKLKKLKPLHTYIKGRKLVEHATKIIPNKKLKIKSNWRKEYE